MTARSRIVTFLSGIVLLGLAASAGATSILVENFDDVGTLGASGWVLTNALAINWEGSISGDYVDSNGVPHG